MTLPQEEIDQALEYIKNLKIHADVEPFRKKNLVFERIPEIPPTITNEEIRSTLDICIEYHQRCVFTGEYLSLDPNPPVRRTSENPLDDINFYLDYYKNKLMDEVKKGLSEDMDESEFLPKAKLTPFAKVMIRHRNQQKKNNK